MKKSLKAIGVEVSPAPPEELDAFLKSQQQDGSRLLQDFNIAPLRRCRLLASEPPCAWIAASRGFLAAAPSKEAT